MNKRIVITIIFALVLITVFGIDLFEIVFIEEEIPIYGSIENLIEVLVSLGLAAFLIAIKFLLGLFGFKLPFSLPFIFLSGGIGALVSYWSIKIVQTIKTPPDQFLVNILLIVTIIINITLFYNIIGEKK